MKLQGHFETKEITIRDNKFLIQPFHAMEAFRLQAVLMQKFGPALGELLGAVDLKEIDLSNAKINNSQIGKAIETLFVNLGEEEYIKLLLRLVKNTECVLSLEGGKEKISLDSPDNIDKAFRKHTFDIFTLIINILKVNYEDFFVLLEGIGSSIKTLISSSGKTKKEK
jgi:hypothetical protein